MYLRKIFSHIFLNRKGRRKRKRKICLFFLFVCFAKEKRNTEKNVCACVYLFF